MKKLAIIVDSFSGRSKKEVEKMPNHFFLALRIIINGKEYKDGIDQSKSDLMELSNKNSDIKTSQPSPAEIEELFKKLSKEYENVIYLVTPPCLSGTNQTAQMIANDFKNIYVVPGVAVGSAYFELSQYLLKESEKGTNIKELVTFSQKYVNDLPTFVIPKDVQAFVRGGRMGKSLSLIFDKMRLIPIILMDDLTKLKKKAVKKTGRKAAEYAINKLLEIMQNSKAKIKDYQFLICYTLDNAFAKKAIAMMKERKFNVKTELTTPITNAHTGNGAYSIGAYRKLLV